MSADQTGSPSRHLLPGSPPTTANTGETSPDVAPPQPPSRPPAAASRPPAAPPGKSAPVEAAKDNFREVIETVVFVVVLVLLLKSFAAEAFVIPTGSMAETLYGYQKLVKCPECGLEFPVNCSEEVEENFEVIGCVCPNCRLEIKLKSPPGFDFIKLVLILGGAFLGWVATGWVVGQIAGRKEPSGPVMLGAQVAGAVAVGVVLWVWAHPAGAAGNSPADELEHDSKPVIEAGPNTGDRVLVGKFLWDSGLRDLERWDVAVFKFPEEPQRHQTPKNYIKRVTGLPGETIGILGGDLFVAENLRYGEPDLDDSDLPLRRQTHKNAAAARRLLEDGSPVFRILRKPPDKMLAMRRLVYDNDHQARDLLKVFPSRWAPEKDVPGPEGPAETAYRAKRDRAEADGAWAADGPHGFRHKARSGDDLDWLRYRHLLSTRSRPKERVPAPPCEPIKDVMGYNSGISKDRGIRCSDGDNWVGDLLLECEVTVERAEGELVLELSKGVDRFRARWQLPAGTCTLVRLGPDGHPQELDQQPTALTKPGTYRLRFANVDERLTVWVDGKLPFGDGVAYDPPRKDPNDPTSAVVRGPGSFVEKNDLEPASIGVRGAGLSVQKLKVWRDTYYTNYNGVQTLYVQPGHYLCMGDNSPCSSDSRSWGHQDHDDRRGGLVPERLLLGRALLVYWPPSRFGPIR
jgi:signal peptidase I